MADLRKHLIFTIIAPNYGAQAMILGESVLQSLPESIFRIVLLQDCGDVTYIQKGINEYLRLNNSTSDHKAVSFQDFDWNSFDVLHAVNKYDLLEFATSVKPSILLNYINSGYDRVTYLDPDIQVFADFTEALDSSKCISVTPHIFTDFPMDSKLPNHQSILNAGIYNLGFISVTSESLAFLKWWREKLNNFCLMDVRNGFHVDQRWVDWATCFADIDVVRDPGFNVAYWNLHERTVIGKLDYEVEFMKSQTYKLRFFHFSGFIGPNVQKISRHNTRTFPKMPALDNVLKNYFERKLFWKRFLGATHWSLGGRFAGESLPRAWRMEIPSTNQKKYKHIHEDVFKLQYSSRCECANCGSNFAQNSTAHFLKLINRNYISELNILTMKQIKKKLVQNKYSENLLGLNKSYPESKSSLLLIGYFGAPTGVGQIARNTLRLLEDSGISVNIHIIPTGFDDESIYNEYQTKHQMNGKESKVIAFVNADMWIEHLVKTRLIDLKHQTVAGVWAWEIENFPDYFKYAAQYVSQIYAISQFSASALGVHLGQKIDVFPTFGNIPLQTDQLEPPQSNQAKYVLARFDSKSVIERKNPQAILNVWELVKNKLTDYNLLLKTIDLRKYASVDLIERIQNCERVQLIDEIYSEDQNASLTKGASAYVSLHRAEGLGLNILEALAADIPTVVTNYSGLSEEIERFVFPVDYKLIPIGDNAAPYPPEGFWADPLTDSAAEQLLNAIKVRESGEWETRKKSRLLDLENYLKVAQIQTLAHVGQLLAQVDKDRVSTFRKFSRLRVNRIKTSWLAKYRRAPLPIRKLLRSIFFRYFKM